MAERSSDGGGSFPINPSVLLTLLAVVGSVWFVSHRLTSTRPAASAGGLPDFIGEQTLESRLWEDPFKASGNQAELDGLDGTETNLTALVTQIRMRVSPSNAVLILPVMLPGGTYSEDRESRIRSRFAIESALGQSGYAPEDSEHIGWIKVPWPTTAGIYFTKTNLNQSSPKDFVLALKEKNVIPANKTPRSLELRFEWHRPKVFYPGAVKANKPKILVLWLNNSYFEDEPLLRLPLLLAPLMKAASPDAGLARVALIGPRNSSTLRAMLPDWKSRKLSLSNDFPELWPKLTSVFHHIDIYSATASAMDETLVRTNSDGPPRTSVGSALTNIGFHSFQNFAATDDQLAREILDELALRGATLANTNNHLVLISEWDTFYARMLSLTYGAELAVTQHRASNRTEFIDTYVSVTNDWQMPTNFHSFVYLRGLDGQTVGSDGDSSGNGTGNEDGSKTGPASIEDIRKWTPDANKAEGPAQFDYLGRLGDQIEDLQEKLHRDNQGHIKAIGVVGSDVYDTLLILQALRPRFHEVLFFTTDLDARLWHPREQAWSRNLILASGYNLMLHRRLQQEVAPFRDSSQTALFAATLAALGHPKLSTLTNVPPRRFEIGKYGAVDLRMARGTNSMSAGGQLHPQPARRVALGTKVGICIVCLMAILLATFFVRPLRRLTWEASRFQAEALAYDEEDLGGADGAQLLASDLHTRAEKGHDSLAEWLLKEFSSGPKPQLGGYDTTYSAKGWYQALLDSLEKRKDAKTPDQEQSADREIETCRQKLLRCFIGGLNRLLRRQIRIPDENLPKTKLLSKELKAAYEGWQAGPLDLPDCLTPMRQGRAILDALLQKLSEEGGKPGVADQTGVLADVLDKADAARKASLKLYALRNRWVLHFRIVGGVVIALALALAAQIWWDAFRSAKGEPFSLTTGTSAWPAEIIRLVAFVLAGGFILQLYQNLRGSIFVLTRLFRLPLFSPASRLPESAFDELEGLPTTPAETHHGSESSLAGGSILQNLRRLPARMVSRYEFYKIHFGLPEYDDRSAIDASRLWSKYQQLGSFKQRMRRIGGPIILYLGLCFAIWLSSGEGLIRPLRGTAAMSWDLGLLFATSLGFLCLTFMTMDASLLCRWFIRQLCEAPTEYPLATSRYFSRLRGNVDKHYLDEWIDLQLIADLTERVSKLVYYPSIVFFLLLVARNEWWDHWNWPWWLITIYVLNLALAAASVVILQNAARRAKRDAEDRLEAKVKQLQAITAESEAHNNANQAERLLEEIRNLRRGAFVPFWESPVLGAILLPSGGTAFLQMIVWFMGH